MQTRLHPETTWASIHPYRYSGASATSPWCPTSPLGSSARAITATVRSPVHRLLPLPLLLLLRCTALLCRQQGHWETPGMASCARSSPLVLPQWEWGIGLSSSGAWKANGRFIQTFLLRAGCCSNWATRDLAPHQPTPSAHLAASCCSDLLPADYLLFLQVLR